MTGIGTLRETALHASLKAWLAEPGDALEAHVDGCVVDILRGDLVIEIQTHNFGAIRSKLLRLAERRPVRLVHPIALERWLVNVGRDGETQVSRRKSPKRGSLVDVVHELVCLPALMAHPNFSLELLLIREEELRRPLPAAHGRRWRPKTFRVSGRRLMAVLERRTFSGPDDCLCLLPSGLVEPFTNRDLARACGKPAGVAEKITYCLRHMGALMAIGKRGRAIEYVRTAP